MSNNNSETPVLNSLEGLISQVSKLYPFLDKKEYNTFLYNASNIVRDKSLDTFKKAENILGLLKNPHAGIFLSQEMVLPSEWRKNYVDPKKPVYKMIEDIIYLQIPSLENVDYEDLENPFLEFKDKSKGLIIDIRYNRGGQEFPARKFVSQYLAKKGKHVVGTNVTRGVGSSLNKDEIFIQGTDDPYAKPIIVLINDDTFSSAERFVSVLKASTDCIIIGTKTRGGSGNPSEFSLNLDEKQYSVRIPTWRFFLPGEEEALENTKITPDIEYEGEDIIDYALSYIENLHQ